jgi:hypothetical protein
MQEDGRGKIIPPKKKKKTCFSFLGWAGSGPALMTGPGSAQTKRNREDCGAESGPAHIIIMLYIIYYIYMKKKF